MMDKIFLATEDDKKANEAMFTKVQSMGYSKGEFEKEKQLKILEGLLNKKFSKDYIEKCSLLLYSYKSPKYNNFQNQKYPFLRSNLDKAIYSYDDQNDQYLTLPVFSMDNKEKKKTKVLDTNITPSIKRNFHISQSLNTFKDSEECKKRKVVFKSEASSGLNTVEAKSIHRRNFRGIKNRKNTFLENNINKLNTYSNDNEKDSLMNYYDNKKNKVRSLKLNFDKDNKNDKAIRKDIKLEENTEKDRKEIKKEVEEEIPLEEQKAIYERLKKIFSTKTQKKPVSLPKIHYENTRNNFSLNNTNNNLNLINNLTSTNYKYFQNNPEIKIVATPAQISGFDPTLGRSITQGKTSHLTQKQKKNLLYISELNLFGNLESIKQKKKLISSYYKNEKNKNTNEKIFETDVFHYDKLKWKKITEKLNKNETREKIVECNDNIKSTLSEMKSKVDVLVVERLKTEEEIKNKLFHIDRFLKESDCSFNLIEKGNNDFRKLLKLGKNTKK